MGTPLFRIIADEIRANGPIGLDRYMALCLGHPAHGYYRTRDPLGAAGDFVTAPEISQMFGELIGVFIAATRAAMGGSEPVCLVELGPGRGTLMADALRALRAAAPDAGFRLHLVETSPILRRLQAERLSGVAPEWHEDIASLPDGPAIVIANEFFDALPVRQFERSARGWHERRVGLSPDGARLVRGLSPEPDRRIAPSIIPRSGPRFADKNDAKSKTSKQAYVDEAAQACLDAPNGVVLTLPGAALETVRALAANLVREGGALLVIDYGHARSGFGDTLQAVAGHRFVDPFAAPGEADLTSHVDFSALARAAQGAGACVHGPVDQRDFLLALGLRLRADRLKAHASPAQAESIEAAFARLTDPGRRGMGALFKALCIGHPGLSALPGFPTPG